MADFLRTFILNYKFDEKCMLFVMMCFSWAIGISNTALRNEKYLPDYNVYHNLSKIYSEISDIVERNPSYMQLDNTYVSRHGRSQLLLHIANFSDSHEPTENGQPRWTPSKVRILFSFGEHAREYFPIESLFHLLRNLSQGLHSVIDSPEELFSRKMLSKVDLFIIVLLNPDGREYIEKSHNYCWRGTSTGVDVNRNFNWNYGGEGSSSETGSEELRGPQPFSEPECFVLLDITKKYSFDAFVSFHSGIREIYVPFADSMSKRLKRKPSNIELMMKLAKEMAEVTDPHFVYGQAFVVNQYTADGTIFDYMAGIKKIPFSFAVELWGDGDLPEKQCFDLFNPPNKELLRNLEAVHPMCENLFLNLMQWKDKQLKSVLSIETDGPSLLLCFMMLAMVVMVTLLAMCQRRSLSWLQLYPRRRIVSLKSLSTSLHMVGPLLNHESLDTSRQG
ncbi:carboxypeptidase A2-like isoform X3 [Tachypleus tridentatus]|uniref:carboxypeptidase A2-like isoform X3 n=2 Tax=Tachypleus tridentatus TaxID=6853 RepID=UPI003FD31ED9